MRLSERVDITDHTKVAATIFSLRPDVVINAAAYTAVDKAEPEQAMAVDGHALEALAQASIATGAHLLHVSTNFVFGASDGSPFMEDAGVAPFSVYG